VQSSIEQLLLNDSFARFIQSEQYLKLETDLKSTQDRALEYVAPCFEFISELQNFMDEFLNRCTDTQNLSLAEAVANQAITLFPVFSGALLIRSRSILLSLTAELQQTDSSDTEKSRTKSDVDPSTETPASFKQNSALVLNNLLKRIDSMKQEWVYLLLKYQVAHLKAKSLGKKFVQLKDVGKTHYSGGGGTTTSSTSSSSPLTLHLQVAPPSPSSGPQAFDYDDEGHDDSKKWNVQDESKNKWKNNTLSRTTSERKMKKKIIKKKKKKANRKRRKILWSLPFQLLDFRWLPSFSSILLGN